MSDTKPGECQQLPSAFRASWEPLSGPIPSQKPRGSRDVHKRAHYETEKCIFLSTYNARWFNEIVQFFMDKPCMYFVSNVGHGIGPDRETRHGNAQKFYPGKILFLLRSSNIKIPWSCSLFCSHGTLSLIAYLPPTYFVHNDWGYALSEAYYSMKNVICIRQAEIANSNSLKSPTPLSFISPWEATLRTDTCRWIYSLSRAFLSADLKSKSLRPFRE